MIFYVEIGLFPFYAVVYRTVLVLETKKPKWGQYLMCCKRIRLKFCSMTKYYSTFSDYGSTAA